VSSLFKLKITSAMEIPIYWLRSYINLFLFKREPSIITLLAKNIECFSVDCHSVFHSISTYIWEYSLHTVFLLNH